MYLIDKEKKTGLKWKDRKRLSKQMELKSKQE
jgi:hypothetical protein